MKNLWAYAMVALLPISPTFAEGDAPNGEVQILQVGQFHGDEVKAKSGEEWLGLYERDGEYVLLPVTLKVEPAFDALLDFDPKNPEERSKKTGKSVEAIADNMPETARVILLLKGGGFTPGKVDTAFPVKADNDLFNYYTSREMGDFGPLPSIHMKIQKHDYALLLELGWPWKEDPKREQCALYLWRAGKAGIKQMIARQYPPDSDWYNDPKIEIDALGCYPGDGFPKLAWAGDIDRDGKLDLILEPRFHYNNSTTTLFLSSVAGKNELVKRVAHFTATGC